MRLLVDGGNGAVGARISGDHDRLTLWVDRVADRSRRMAAGISLTAAELEALIWKLASLRAHMTPPVAVLPQLAEGEPLRPRVSLSTSYRPKKPSLRASIADLAASRRKSRR